MRLKAGLLVLTLVTAGLAGCLQTATEVTPEGNAVVDPIPTNATTLLHRAGGVAVSATEAGSDLLAEAVTFALNHDAVEPTLGITSDGTIFYAAATFANGDMPAPKTDILRSKDGGLTWEDVTPKLPAGGYNNPPVTFDPYVYVDPMTDRVFAIELEALACSVLSVSDDGGDTWITNPLGCGLPPGVHDHHTIAAGPSRLAPTAGYPNIVYYCVNRIADSSCATSLNGGLSFGPLVTAFPGVEATRFDPESGEGFCGGLHAHVHVGPDGTAYLPKGQCDVPMVAISEDDGLTWSQVVINRDVGTLLHEVSIATDEAGNVYAFWIGLDGRAYLAASTDRGYTWGEAIDVTAPGVTAAHLPSLAAAGVGKVAFVYTGTTLEGGYENEQNSDAWDTAFWHGYLGFITNATDPNATIVTTQVNPSDDPLVYGRCGPGRCPGMYDFIDVVIDHAGRPWGAFVDACDQCTSAEDSLAFNGLLATLSTGPSLLTAGGALPPIPTAPAAAGNETADGGLTLAKLVR